jgi:hypothetical protein
MLRVLAAVAGFMAGLIPCFLTMLSYHAAAELPALVAAAQG